MTACQQWWRATRPVVIIPPPPVLDSFEAWDLWPLAYFAADPIGTPALSTAPVSTLTYVPTGGGFNRHYENGTMTHSYVPADLAKLDDVAAAPLGLYMRLYLEVASFGQIPEASVAVLDKDGDGWRFLVTNVLGSADLQLWSVLAGVNSVMLASTPFFVAWTAGGNEVAFYDDGTTYEFRDLNSPAVITSGASVTPGTVTLNPEMGSIVVYSDSTNSKIHRASVARF